MAAARTGHVPTAVKLLLEAGADVNAHRPYQDETALMWAAAEGHTDVVTALLKAGADANRKTRITTITERKNSDSPDRRLDRADVSRRARGTRRPCAR